MKVGTDGVLLGAWCDIQNSQNALDIGAGTGLIALMIAQRTEQTIIHSVEIDEDAYEQCHFNFQQSPWFDRLTVFHQPIQEYWRSTNETYDLIVSNPPFFSGGTFSEKQQRTNVRHTVKLPHGDLLIAVRRLLSPKGKFCVILPFIEGLRFEELAKTYHLYCTKMMEIKPLANKPVERLLLQFERTEGSQQKEELIIQNEGRNNWTKDYIALTGDFYLKM